MKMSCPDSRQRQLQAGNASDTVWNIYIYIHIIHIYIYIHIIVWRYEFENIFEDVNFHWEAKIGRGIGYTTIQINEVHINICL